MGDNRTHPATGPDQKRDAPSDAQRDKRRRRMQAAEGHAGSTPRGNQEVEHDSTDQRRGEFDRVLGH